MAQEYGFCLADELNFTPRKNTLIPNREWGAIFDLVGSFGINIRGDPYCVPLSPEGLSEATTRNLHRICSMWMTCVNAQTTCGHAKEPIEFDGVQDRGACDFPWSSSGLDWSTCGWNDGAAPSSPNIWGCCHDQLCWNVKSIMALWVSACKIQVPFTR